MRVFVTGATGFLGGHLAARLAEGGHEIALLVRRGSIPRVPISLADFETHLAGEWDPEGVFAHGRFDAVVHCATAYGRHGADVGELIDANVLLPMRILAAAARNGTRLFVNSDSFFCSQLDAGKDPSDVYLPEYTLSKWQFCQWARVAVAKTGMAVANMRLQQVYGEHDSEDKFVPWLVRELVSGVPAVELRNPGAKRDFVHVSDAVGAYMAVLEHWGGLGNGFSTVDVGLGEPMTVRGFAEGAARALGSHARFVPFPGQAAPGEVACSAADLTALRSLGWVPLRRDHGANIRAMAASLSDVGGRERGDS